MSKGPTQIFVISGDVTYDYGPVRLEKRLRRVQITYTVKDITSGQTLGSFSMVAPDAECGLVATRESASVTYVGQRNVSGIGPEPLSACALTRVSAPASDRVTLEGRFAGNANFAPSVSTAEEI
jgi:hypothetical protein